MNRQVWKYLIGHQDDVALDIPAGAQVLHFGIQNGIPMLWVLVDPDAPRMQRQFRLAGTGHTLERAERLTYIGTVMDIPFVWHLFEVN